MPLADFNFDPHYKLSPDYDPQLWRTLYSFRGRGYLADLTEAELNTRYEVILRNKASFSSPEHVAHGPHNDPYSFWYWVRREEECEEEFLHRKLALPSVILGVPTALRTIIPPVARRSLRDSGMIARFSGNGRLRDSYDHGKFRLKHAKGFDDPKLNEAQRDKELVASSFSPSHAVTIVAPDGTATKPKGKVTHQKQQGGDAYLLCAATEFDPWLFHYFGVDACMIVEDVEELRVRLDAAFNAKMKGHGQAEFRVFYVDEYNPNPTLTKHDDPGLAMGYSPLATKSLHYALQKEFRFLWYSTAPADPSAPPFVDIEAGPLSDIAKYYRWNSTAGTLEHVP